MKIVLSAVSLFSLALLLIILFVKTKEEWSLGIFKGDSPLSLFPDPDIINPILTAKDITDIPADLIADPFMLKEDTLWHMFFEVKGRNSGKGSIGHAESNDGVKWAYKSIVLDEPFHLSYPYVFKYSNDYYMVPESHEAGSVRLYKAEHFPGKWVYIKTLLNYGYVDSSIINYKDMWWIFASTTDMDELFLYYSENLFGHFKEHTKSPVIKKNNRIARPAGRLLNIDNKIIRYAQECGTEYGEKVWAYEVTVLDRENYEERQAAENPVIKSSGKGWNAVGMHHIDAQEIAGGKWIACVDGYKKTLVFGFFLKLRILNGFAFLKKRHSPRTLIYLCIDFVKKIFTGSYN